MDPSADVFYGPNPVQRTGAVTVPKELLREIGVQGGEDKVHWALNPEVPGTLIMVPDALFARITAGALDLLRSAGT